MCKKIIETVLALFNAECLLCQRQLTLRQKSYQLSEEVSSSYQRSQLCRAARFRTRSRSAHDAPLAIERMFGSSRLDRHCRTFYSARCGTSDEWQRIDKDQSKQLFSPLSQESWMQAEKSTQHIRRSPAAKQRNRASRRSTTVKREQDFLIKINATRMKRFMS